MPKIKRRLSPLKPNHVIDYKDVELLRSFLSEQGKILPRRSTNLTLQQQRQLAKAVKRARILNLLSFVSKDNEKEMDKPINKEID
jgi:small subunit ribosomal protein S18